MHSPLGRSIVGVSRAWGDTLLANEVVCRLVGIGLMHTLIGLTIRAAVAVGERAAGSTTAHARYDGTGDEDYHPALDV